MNKFIQCLARPNKDLSPGSFKKEFDALTTAPQRHYNWTRTPLSSVFNFYITISVHPKYVSIIYCSNILTYSVSSSYIFRKGKKIIVSYISNL